MAYAGHKSPMQRLAPSLVTLGARLPGCPAWRARPRCPSSPHAHARCVAIIAGDMAANRRRVRGGSAADRLPGGSQPDLGQFADRDAEDLAEADHRPERGGGQPAALDLAERLRG